jgi:putative flippase GtrA
MSGALLDRGRAAARSYPERSGSLRGAEPDAGQPGGGRIRRPPAGHVGLSPPRHRRGRHRRRAPPGSPRALVAEHGSRFLSFSIIGAFVFVLGLGFQAFLFQVLHVSSDLSYLAQGFVSVQVSFLLNYYWTWRDVSSPFWRTCYKFNVQKIITTIFNLLVYAGLTALGVNYLVANIITTVIFTAVNYVFGNRWTFVPPEGKKHCPPPLA